jgi:S1-C subfamily serine protease
VTEFEGKPVADSRHLQLMVAEKSPGSEVRMKVIHQGAEQTLTAKLGELPLQLASQPSESGGQEGN